MAVNTVNTVLDSGLWKAGVAGIGEFQGAVRGLPGVLSKGLSKGATEAGNTLLNITSRTFPQVLTGLSKIGDTAKTAWHTLADDSLLGKITGIFGKVGGVIGKAVGAVGGQLASGLQTMMGIALKALMPAAMIGAALAGLGLLQEKFGEQINSILAMVQEKGPQVISNFANGIASRVPELISQGATLVSNLLNTIGPCRRCGTECPSADHKRGHSGRRVCIGYYLIHSFADRFRHAAPAWSSAGNQCESAPYGAGSCSGCAEFRAEPCG